MTKMNRERVFELLSIYESILSNVQKKALEDHYAYDLSFGEISKQHSISRAAVNDNVKKAISKMEEFESKLHLLDLKNQLRNIKDKCSEEDIKKMLEKVLEKYYGV